ncbi:hypothetical protein M878_46090 (plasmid) [Streptomyces roseochromogenus subsp. oscitans DS 12.976]|uniref:Uncharacterized protein n=1 Tax=Streptomyces roseochromogenus subsp. oscitans DS 12.976 TaxID=1352936 RepID=V6JE89_STRRC|nr:hypothetical protein M878_46090 [Streptomyces roseochromogenus subsp. oscitans DS 12.976]
MTDADQQRMEKKLRQVNQRPEQSLPIKTGDRG